MLHLKDQWVLKKLIIERSHGRSKTLSSQRMKGAMWQNPLFEFLRLSWFTSSIQLQNLVEKPQAETHSTKLMIKPIQRAE